MHKIVILVICVVISGVYLTGCNDNEEVPEVLTIDSSFNDTLVDGATYKVLDVREFTESKYSYGSSASKPSMRVTTLIVQNVDTNERLYFSISFERDEINKSEDYLRMTYLVEDDIFKYLGDYKYEMIE